MTNQEKLKNLALKFYSSLFNSEPRAVGGFLRGHFPLIPEEKDQMLEEPCRDKEITRSIKETCPYKAPGPNNFQAAFFQCLWTTTGQAVKAHVK